jgi:hypothetical protein
MARSSQHGEAPRRMAITVALTAAKITDAATSLSGKTAPQRNIFPKGHQVDRNRKQPGPHQERHYYTDVSPPSAVGGAAEQRAASFLCKP